MKKTIIKYGNYLIKESKDKFTIKPGMYSLGGSFPMVHGTGVGGFDLCQLKTCLTKFDAIV